MATASETLQERMKMSHLQGGLEELKGSVEAQTRAPDDAIDPRDQETCPITLSYTDVRGQVWSGQFVNRILSLEEQGYVAIMRSRLQGGQPLDSIDRDVIEVNLALSHMSYSLDAEKRPSWAKGDKLLKMKDGSIVLALWAEVRAHEDRYFRRGPNPA